LITNFSVFLEKMGNNSKRKRQVQSSDSPSSKKAKLEGPAHGHSVDTISKKSNTDNAPQKPLKSILKRRNNVNLDDRTSKDEKQKNAPKAEKFDKKKQDVKGKGKRKAIALDSRLPVSKSKDTEPRIAVQSEPLVPAEQSASHPPPSPDAKISSSVLIFAGSYERFLYGLRATPSSSTSSASGQSFSIDLEPVFAFAAHQSCIKCLAATMDGRYLLSGGTDDVTKVWDLRRKQEMGVLGGLEGVDRVS
jgi:hypothetical protein